MCQTRANGAEPEQRVLQAESIQWPNDWSADGRFLIYQARAAQAKYDLWVLPFDGSRHAFPFLQTPFDEQQAQFSPDGHWVAYTSDETGVPEVYFQSFPAGGGKWKVSIDGGCQPRWRRDGRELFYLSANRRIMAVDVTLTPAVSIAAPRPPFCDSHPRRRRRHRRGSGLRGLPRWQSLSAESARQVALGHNHERDAELDVGPETLIDDRPDAFAQARVIQLPALHA